jgi:uncharacterized protein YjiS (DUF1127 family)
MLRDLTMPTATATAPRGWRGLVRAVATVVSRWAHRRRSRAQLTTLPPHLLRDIGLCEAEAELEARKPFWRA